MNYLFSLVDYKKDADKWVYYQKHNSNVPSPFEAAYQAIQKPYYLKAKNCHNRGINHEGVMHIDC